jgi:hypothetical protein
MVVIMVAWKFALKSGTGLQNRIIIEINLELSTTLIDFLFSLIHLRTPMGDYPLKSLQKSTNYH